MGLELTVDEMVETLKRSSLTTVLVEGKDDVMVYRWMEDEVGIVNASFFPCGGRKNLLKIYERRSEFADLKTIFIADKDAFVYSNTPKEYNEVLWTHGYSIENDLYFGRKIESILSTKEKDVFNTSLTSFAKYYAFEIEQCKKGNTHTFRNHPAHIICEKENTVKSDFLESVSFEEPIEETFLNLINNYDVLIRGKSLFALLTRIVSRSKRQIKHSKATLLEHCYRTHRSEKFIDLIAELKLRINSK